MAQGMLAGGGSHALQGLSLATSHAAAAVFHAQLTALEGHHHSLKASLKLHLLSQGLCPRHQYFTQLELYGGNRAGPASGNYPLVLGHHVHITLVHDL